MATRCEEVTARMLELLYGELPEGERATLQAHVDGCARCKAELAAFTETRALARQVLDEPPPARVRASILQAAAAHVATTKPEVALAAAPARATVKPRAKESQPSFWDRLRARWALPTLATVGAIAVFLIASKLLLEPNKAYNLGREAMAPAETEQKAAPAAPTPAVAPSAAVAPEDEGRLREEPEQARRGSESAPHHHAKAAAEKDVDDRTLRHATIDESLGALKAAKKPAHADAKERLAAPSGGAAIGNLGGRAAGKGAGVGASGGAPLDGLMDSAPSGSPGQFAPPPPPRPSAPPPKAKARPAAEPAFAPPLAAAPAPARKPAKRDISDDALEGFGGPAAAPRRDRDEAPMAAEEAEAPAEQPRAKAKRASEAADKGVAKKAEAPAASAPAAQAAPASATRSANAPAEPLVQRADRLFAQGQWAEAAAAYRELINRDPRNADAPRWRQRLVSAERENDAAMAARAAAKRAPAKRATETAPAKAAPASAAPPER